MIIAIFNAGPDPEFLANAAKLAAAAHANHDPDDIVIFANSGPPTEKTFAEIRLIAGMQAQRETPSIDE